MTHKNYVDSLSYFAKNFHDIRSMFQLGLLYHQGCFVTRYPEEARYWLNKVKELDPTYYSGDIDTLLKELD